MASHWFNRNAAGSSNNSARSYGNEKPEEDLDLSLKLGLPDEHNTNANLINPLLVNPVTNDYLSNMNFNSSPYQCGETLHRPVGGYGSHEYQYGMAGRPANPGFRNNFPMNDQGRRIYYGSNKLHDMGNYQHYQNRINPMSSRVENHFNMMNTGAGGSIMTANRNSSGYSTIVFPPPLTINEYTLIDTLARRRRNIETHEPFLDGSSSAAVRGGHRQHTGTNNEPNRRCSNFNCGATDTPMWRRGPLGPKSLCNACGIKYRKEEEKRKGKQASSSSG